MEEQLLQFIWHRGLFNHIDLMTTGQEALEVIHTGMPNQDQGPDFVQARIRIGDQIWAGHVEIHIRSSAWFLHMHEHDSHYNNVILHVVWEEDTPALTLDGYRIPCLELAPRVDIALLNRYRHLMNNEEWVPCASALMTVSEIIRTGWLQRLIAERLEAKSAQVLRILERCAYDWEQTFYTLLARQMGAPANGDAMEELASRIPLKLIRKHQDRPDQMEALLFGAAGMLGKEAPGDYAVQLKKEFDFLLRKYSLRPMPALQWKFMRMRPAHFPTIRIAQLAAILTEVEFFVSRIEHGTQAQTWIDLFSVRPKQVYWHTHYHFAAEAETASGRVGRSTAITLLINVVIPFMFVYGKHMGNRTIKAMALTMAEDLPAEKNAVMNGWSACGWSPKDAGQSQALLYLKKQYCDHRRCLHCAIGLQVLK